jgi:hypothetical protein
VLSRFAVGSDAGREGLATVFNADQSAAFTVTPFPGFTGGVRTVSVDLNADGVPELVVGTGPGISNRVVILDGKSQQPLASFQPFEPAFVGGVFLAAGDVNGDGVPDLVATPDRTGGPVVALFDGAALAVGQVFNFARFMGIDDPNFRGGAWAAIGDVNGDGFDDVVVSAGFGGGPRVAVFDGRSVAGNGQGRLAPDFFAFEPGLRNGAYVALGDFNRDGQADLTFGAGPGGGPRVRVLDAKSRGGVRVAVTELDGEPNLLVGAGDNAGSRVTTYPRRAILASPFAPNPDLDFDAIPGFGGGVFVG